MIENWIRNLNKTENWWKAEKKTKLDKGLTAKKKKERQDVTDSGLGEATYIKTETSAERQRCHPQVVQSVDQTHKRKPPGSVCTESSWIQRIPLTKVQLDVKCSLLARKTKQ